MSANKNTDLKVAWLLPKIGFFWQPMLSEFTKLFPKTTIFTAQFPGFIEGLEDSMDIQIIGKPYMLGKKDKSSGYSSRLTFISPKVVFPLLRLKPQIIFASSFGIWTMLALLLKPLSRWRVVIAYEGSSPSVDFTNSPLRLWLRRLMIKTADACITNSEAGKVYLTEVLQAESGRVFAQPYEVPAAEGWLKNCNPTEITSEMPRPIFLFVGRVVPRKGLNILLEACKLLKQQGYDDYTLLIAGDGNQREELQAFCRVNNLANCVQWQGWINYSELSFYFKNSDVFILPTLEDTWGVVVLEAMLCGKAVICSSDAGSSETIVNERNGYIFPSKQPKKLAELMSLFIENPDLIEQMGKQSKLVMTKYTPKAASQFLAEVTNFVFS